MSLQKFIILFFSFVFGYLTQAGVGGAGGGVGKYGGVKYTEIRVCESGYDGPGAICSIVRLKTEKYLEQQAALLKPGAAECYRYHGEVEIRVPCDQDIEHKIPYFLQQMNDSFKEQNNDPSYDDQYLN